MRFVPYIYGKDNTQIPVSILPMSVQDAVQTDTEPLWQTSWTSDYLSDPRLEKYAVRLNDELIADEAAKRIFFRAIPHNAARADSEKI